MQDEDENDDLIIKIDAIISSFDELSAKEFTFLIDTLVFNHRITVQDLKNKIVIDPSHLEVIGDKLKDGKVWASIRFRNPGIRFKYTVYVSCEDQEGKYVGLIFSDPNIMYNDLVNQVNGIEIQRDADVQIITHPGSETLFGKLFGIHYFDVSNCVYKQSANTVHVVLKSPKDADIVVILDSGESLILKCFGYSNDEEDDYLI